MYLCSEDSTHIRVYYVNRREKGKDGKELCHQLEEDTEDKENGICQGTCWRSYHNRPQVNRQT